MVFAQLRTSVIVREGYDGVHALPSVRFPAQPFRQLVGDAVHAAHRWDNPYLVPYACVAVLAPVSLESQVFFGDVERYCHGVVRIVQQSRQICLDFFLANPASLRHVLVDVSDGVAVFDYVFPFLEVFERHLMAGRHVRFQRDAPSVHLNFVSRTKGRDGHGHIVGRIDFQISSFHYDRIVVDCSQTCASK